jgi:hypothetical protein
MCRDFHPPGLYCYALTARGEEIGEFLAIYSSMIMLLILWYKWYFPVCLLAFRKRDFTFIIMYIYPALALPVVPSLSKRRQEPGPSGGKMHFINSEI